MRFWDSSAIVPLVVAESGSADCTALLDRPPVVWVLTPVEVVSVLDRRARDGAVDTEALASARHRLGVLREGWAEVRDVPGVRDRAERLLAVHSLRAADALQLAAALILCRDRPGGQEFVCLDRTLSAAALREGFKALP